jgi:cell wall-associated NlpC family hydrolase
MAELRPNLIVPDGWQADLIGAAWTLHAAGPEAFDCWGLVERVWADRMGLDLSVFRSDPVSEDSRDRGVEVAVRVDGAVSGGRFIPLDRPCPLAIGVVRYKRFPVHVGLYAQGGLFVHACEDSGQVRQDRIETYRTRTGSLLAGWYWPAADTPKTNRVCGS